MILLDQQPVKQRLFPNGEVGYSDIGPYREYQSISLKWESDADLLHLKFVVDVIRRHQGSVNKLIIEYMPYSRMDRVRGDWAFTLKSVAEFINALKFPRVEVIEPHSDVTCALLDNAFPRYVSFPQGFAKATTLFKGTKRNPKWDSARDWLVFPDAGAEKRYQSEVTEQFNVVVGQKERDFETGKITGFDIWPEHRYSQTTANFRYKAIILDDLCAFGGTFLATMEVLKEDYQVDEVILVVAHCEHNIHAGDLLASDLLTAVVTTDTIYRPDMDGVPPHPKIHFFDWRNPIEQSQKEDLL